MADLRFDPEQQDIVFSSGEYLVAIYRGQTSPAFHVYGPNGIHLQTWKTQLQAERMASVRNQQFPQWDEIPQPRKQTRADRPQKSRLDVAPEVVSEWLANNGDCPKCKHRLRKRRDRGDGMPEANCDACGYADNLCYSLERIECSRCGDPHAAMVAGQGNYFIDCAKCGHSEYSIS